MSIQNLPHKKILLIIGLVAIAVGGFLLVNTFSNRDGAQTSIGSLLNTEDDLVPDPPPGNTEVFIDSEGFTPSTVQTAKGWQVTWINKDEKPHRIAADPYPAVSGQTLFDSEMLSTNDTFSYVFSEPGTYTYYDYGSPLKIKGTILVK